MKITNKLIWEYLKEGKSMDHILLLETTDDLHRWVTHYVKTLTEMYDMVKSVCEMTYKQYIDDDMSKEEATQTIIGLHENFHDILFGMYDGKDVTKNIWDRVEPEILQTYSPENLQIFSGKLRLEMSKKNSIFVKNIKNVKD